MQKLLEEEMTRVPKAKLYTFSTDYTVPPPKPDPKPCTRQEPFQLESMEWREDVLHQEIEEDRGWGLGSDEVRIRFYKAQSVMKKGHIPVAKKVRKLLTEVSNVI
ncbi:hypothetical protein POM88_023862 [Heracleum sosnowskyi]|uniref:Uncharacterized protein n=1 Tax=Heracleum sosnowskyi TaxID=360622 RepID=A0AAD8IKM8_9APIA|nr:hypothetical protein POM88_023862 [Heracleum sosnowskyi]